MAIYYISSSKYTGNPDGSQTKPFKSLFEAKTKTSYQGNWLSDNVFRLLASDTFDDEINLPDQNCLGGNYVIERWTNSTNESRKPILTRAKRGFTWTFDNANGVWVSDPLAHISYGGVILEDGSPLDWRIWKGTRAATAATMTAGSASFDNLGLQYIIKPRSGAPSQHVYAACAGKQNINLRWGGRFLIREIEFQLSAQGIIMGGGGDYQLTGGWAFHDVDVRYCGAGVDVANGVALGNGIGIMHNTPTFGTSYMRRVKVYDCFDSGISPQLFGNGVIDGIEFEDCEAHRCGLTGFETSITSTSGTSVNQIKNVNFRRCLVKDSGKGFAGNRYGGTAHGFSFLTNDSSKDTSVADCGVYDSKAIGCLGSGVIIPHADRITIARTLSHKNAIGIEAGTKTGYATRADYLITDNPIIDCATGIKFGTNGSGCENIAMTAKGNSISKCQTGILDDTKGKELAIADGNTITECKTGIKSNAVGKFVAVKNQLALNETAVSGMGAGNNIIHA